MPPPNITGILHLGHATFLTIQDCLTRFYRKNGYDTLWIPGTDHAGLATHYKILEALDSKNYTEKEYMRTGFKLKNKHHKIITDQIKKIGASCDWNREQYTLSNEFIHASHIALKRLNDAGLLYYKEEQWYISMKDMAIDLISSIENNNFIINDEGSLNELLHMLNNIEDWCISRQIEWGTKLPIYKHKITHEIFILTDEEFEKSEYKIDLIKETSCFDTWFTSSLYPFASLGWPNNTEDYKRYYPTQIIETGADILFFWCARMLMMGKFLTGFFPFKEIFLHGMCRDEKGQKMSKSLGNGIDPLEITNKYGADALRFTILSKTTHKDIKLSESEFQDSFKFMNKIWQSARFFNIHFEKQSMEYEIIKEGDFYQRMEEIKEQFINNMTQRNFIELTRQLQYSFKHEFCDDWIETNKKGFFEGHELTMKHGLYILMEFINLFHCLIPFITEEISFHFSNSSLINKII